MNYDDLKIKAAALRKKIFRASLLGGGAHLGGCFSCIDILAALYLAPLLRYRAQDAHWQGRDRFILSKGHAGLALYATLAEAGFFDAALLDGFCAPGSALGTHPKIDEMCGVEMSSGALGHGLGFGAGLAYAGKLDENENFKVCVMLGDGECQEGSVWEAAMFAAQNKLDNLIAIVDYNKFQAMDKLSTIIELNPLCDKWRSFGWHVLEMDGHNFDDIAKTWQEAIKIKNSPIIIIAHTIKGKGVSIMENAPLWHFRSPSNDAEKNLFFTELQFTQEERQGL